MEFLGWLINILDAQMPKPTPYGWFHIMFLILTALATILLCKKFKNPSEQTIRKILLISAIISIVLEAYKQINFTFSYENGVWLADYQWYAFPYQFCSTPMYIGLLAALIKNKKVHNALCAYLATFAVFAGVCVMAYPGQVFIETIGINFQTMIWHGSMIVIGIYLLYSNYIKLQHKTIIPAICVFAFTLSLAVILNEIAHSVGITKTEVFNMFFISPHCPPSLPIYSLVQEVVPYPLCLIIYILAFSLAAYLILLFAMLIKKLSKKSKKENI